MSNNLLDKAVSQAAQGNRNQTGLWLACQLRDNGFTESAAESVMLDYANQVQGNGSQPYSKQEALATLKSAFNRPPRTKTGEGYINNGRPCQPVNGRVKQAQKRVDTSPTNGVNSVNPATGLTLATIAETKHLPVDFLKSLGISDHKLNKLPVVRIPYVLEDGQESAIRFRLALAGDQRFCWRKGDHPLPYGLSRLEQIRKQGWVMLVEGESDCWTCWYHNIPALGAPGKSVWPIEWKQYLENLEVFVWQEPDAQDFPLRVLKSAPQAKYIVAPEGIKDVSEAHIQGLNVPQWLEELKAKAQSGQILKEQLTNEQLKQAYNETRDIIEAEDPLELIKKEIQALGYGGDLKAPMITYLAASSRLLAMRQGAIPVHQLLLGPSSAGKSYTLRLVLNLLPEEAFHVIDAGSPRVLIYDEAPLMHRVLVFSEADSLPAGEDNPAASAIRNLLQDHYLHYSLTIRDPQTGDYIVREVQKDGPTVMITTSTQSLGHQLMTRLFTLEMADSQEQISTALLTQAAIEESGVKSPDHRLIAFQKYLQLKAPFKVSVPFARQLAASIPRTAGSPRVLRDFARIISLIKTLAVIRHHHRTVNKSGQIVATLEDYQTVRDLINEMYIDSSTGATSNVQELVKAVIRLDASRTEGKSITNTLIHKELNIGVKQVTRRAQKAIKNGWLVNRETRKSYPADYAPGEPLPEAEGLPVLEKVEPVDTVDRVDSEAVPEISLENEGVDRLTPSTESNTPLSPVSAIPAEESPPKWQVEL